MRNSRNKFHQIWSTIFSGSLLMPRPSHVRNLGPLTALLNPQRRRESASEEGPPPPPPASRSALKFATVHGWKGGREETWVVVSQNFQVAAMDLARLELRRERERLDASLRCCVGAALSSLPNLWADRKVAECASRSRSPSLSEAMGWCKILGALAHYLRPT